MQYYSFKAFISVYRIRFLIEVNYKEKKQRLHHVEI